MSDRVSSDATSVFPRYVNLEYPDIDRGDGVWLFTTSGTPILDACSGGDMTCCLGYGVTSVVDAWVAQADKVAYVYDAQFANQPREQLATRLLETVAPEMARVRFVSSGSEANEAALRLARLYHVERGDAARWRVVSPAQSYHGATMGTLALSGRPALHQPYEPYLAQHLHIPPSTWRFDPTGEAALAALDDVVERAGPETIAAFFCEPISAAALPGYAPPDAFWRGLAERRERYGFLVCFDEIVTGMGRVGSWLAAHQLPIEPDIVTLGKGLGAGYTPIAAVLCRAQVYDALAGGSALFDLGHTYDGTPLSCAVSLAVLDVIAGQGLVEAVAARGPQLRDQVATALEGSEMVREVRGRGFLLGLELVDPRDGRSFLPGELKVADVMDDTAFGRGLLVSSTSSAADGFTGDETVLAPAFVSTDEELAQMVERLVETVDIVEGTVKKALVGRSTALR